MTAQIKMKPKKEINLFNQPNNFGCICKTKYEDCTEDLKDCKEFQFHKKQAENAYKNKTKKV
jgi:hypothetical protein